MIEDEDTAFADNYAERDQARALREQARAGGLHFEAYLPGDMADWLLERVERGMFVDPSEAVWAIVRDFIDMEPHCDLRDELMHRTLATALDDPRPALPFAQVYVEMKRLVAEPRPEVARWQKIAR